MTHKFDIQGHEGYLTVGFFADGRPGELFITMAKEGSTVGGLMDVVGTPGVDGSAVRRAAGRVREQVCPQSVRAIGVHEEPGHSDRQERDGLHLPVDGDPVRARVSRGERAEAGDGPPELEEVVSVPVLPPVLKVNGHRTATVADLEHLEASYQAATQARHATEASPEQQREQFASFQSDAPACDNCGALTVRCGTCYRCFNCGNSMGCS